MKGLEGKLSAKHGADGHVSDSVEAMTRTRVFGDQARPHLTCIGSLGLQYQFRARPPAEGKLKISVCKAEAADGKAGPSLTLGSNRAGAGPFPGSLQRSASGESLWELTPHQPAHGTAWKLFSVEMAFSQHSHHVTGDLRPNMWAPPNP